MDHITNAIGQMGGGGGWGSTTPGSESAPGTGVMGGFQKLLPALMLGQGVLGTVGNIQANQARNKVLQAEMAQMSKYANLTPEQIAKGIAGLQRPLSAGLTEGVGNTVQGQMAERGLAQAPGVYSEVLAQALAPYQLSEQERATQAYFQSLGLPIQARPSPFGPFPQETNTAGIWQTLFNQGYNRAGVPSGTAGGPGTFNWQGPVQGGGGGTTPGVDNSFLPADSSGNWWSFLTNPGSLMPNLAVSQ